MKMAHNVPRPRDLTDSQLVAMSARPGELGELADWLVRYRERQARREAGARVQNWADDNVKDDILAD
jgi:hypothetical protein